MRVSLYPRLAWDGIRKNKKLYVPYILTGAVMVMMYYILSYLIESPTLANMVGGSYLAMMLPLGCVVIAVFSLLFLFYTNSFLIRQRYREFGLYNILGMDKGNISKLMMWESLFIAVGAISIGLFAGIALSKIAELILLNLLHMDITFDFYIGTISIRQSLQIYGVIYLILLLNSLRKVRKSRPLELMQSSKVGERIPKRNWIYALAGAVLLVTAYYLAVTIEEPLSAFTIFFGAVILVIIGTYLLFMAGSVAFCKLLQKNKRYYYKPNHFVSVSSMVYRMKRNGAGLASICILLTMVLVMISATASLYFGVENSLKNRYPSDVNVSVMFGQMEGIGDENLEKIRKEIKPYCSESADLTGMRSFNTSGLITDEGITTQMSSSTMLGFDTYDHVGYLCIFSLADYNAKMNENQTLSENECLLYCDRLKYEWDSFAIKGAKPYIVKERLQEFPKNGDAEALVSPTVYLVVNDPYAFIEPVKDLKNTKDSSIFVYEWRFGMDFDSDEAEIKAASDIRESLKALYLEEESHIISLSSESKAAQREGFMELYGSLFFLGIMLSGVFLFAAVLIIYYKQISEGYEDQSRFEIMQKVGMTKKDIRRSINSQMLTVFYAPLVFAGIHLGFAFPFIWRMLMLFGLNDLKLILMVIVICFIIFGLFYALVYRITSNSYYAIVSDGKE